MAEHRRLGRLDRVWVRNPVYFITVCTHDRHPVLAADVAVSLLRDEWTAAQERHGWRIGRFVVMPDHVHFFCAEVSGGAQRPLSGFMRAWKEWTSKRVCRELDIAPPLWQRGFFDHVLRSDESYADKWLYVRENPVRKERVGTWEEWPFQGFVDFDSPL